MSTKAKASSASTRGKAEAASQRGSDRPSRRAQSDSDGFYHGEDIYSKFEEEQQAAEDREAKRRDGTLYLNRFWVPQGENRRIIILDESLRHGFGFYEHNFQGPGGKFDQYEQCVSEYAPCPLCARYGEQNRYFVLYVSVLDIDGYTSRKGKQVPCYKTMLGIKRSQWPSFKDIETAALKKHGTLRGVMLVMGRARGAAQNTPRIGEPKMLDNGQLFDFYTEKELKAEFGHPAIKDDKDKSKIIRPADFNITPYDWGKLFKKPDLEVLNRRYGGPSHGGLPGSDADNAETWGDGSTGETQDESQQRPRRRPSAAEDGGGTNGHSHAEERPGRSRRALASRSQEPDPLARRRR